MTTPRLLAGSALVMFVVLTAALVMRHRELVGLRTEYQDQMTRLASADASPPQPAARNTAERASDESTPPAELLRLRNEVRRLTERKKELGAVAEEHALLQSRWSTRTNVAALPPTYIRRTEARWVGLSTPESALQSFLWAVQSRNPSNIVQVLTPESAKDFLEQYAREPDMVERGMNQLPGFNPVSREMKEDGSVTFTVEIIPGQPMSEAIRARQVNNQWKLDLR